MQILACSVLEQIIYLAETDRNKMILVLSAQSIEGVERFFDAIYEKKASERTLREGRKGRTVHRHLLGPPRDKDREPLQTAYGTAAFVVFPQRVYFLHEKSEKSSKFIAL